MLDEISKIRLNQLNDYARANQNTLKTIYDKGIIDDKNIKEALITPVTVRIWEDLYLLTKDFVFENLPNPELIAYALEHNMFSEEQLKIIPLDQGDTFQTIIDMYGKEDLLDSLKEKLLNPTQPCYEFNQ